MFLPSLFSFHKPKNPPMVGLFSLLIALAPLRHAAFWIAGYFPKSSNSRSIKPPRLLFDSLNPTWVLIQKLWHQKVHINVTSFSPYVFLYVSHIFHKNFTPWDPAMALPAPAVTGSLVGGSSSTPSPVASTCFSSWVFTWRWRAPGLLGDFCNLEILKIRDNSRESMGSYN